MEIKVHFNLHAITLYCLKLRSNQSSKKLIVKHDFGFRHKDGKLKVAQVFLGRYELVENKFTCGRCN